MFLLWILIKKSHPQVHLEEYKYRVKKIKMSKSDSDLDSEKVGSKFDNELMAKLERSGSDSE